MPCDLERERRRTFDEENIAEFRANGGRISAARCDPVLLPTTTGTKSSLPRTSPMTYLADYQARTERPVPVIALTPHC